MSASDKSDDNHPNQEPYPTDLVSDDSNNDIVNHEEQNDDPINESHIDSEVAGNILAFDEDPEQSYLHSDLDGNELLLASDSKSSHKNTNMFASL